MKSFVIGHRNWLQHYTLQVRNPTKTEDMFLTTPDECRKRPIEREAADAALSK